ncbi:MAG TPA: N-acetyltransferase [Thermodesulfobacteriota bacterium]|nr:N-acetyltransferase [Thermodesulfobacteriota bacterium]
MSKANTLKSKIKIRKMEVEDLPRVIWILEAITKTKVSTKKKALLEKHIQKEGSISLVAMVESEVLGYLISEIMTNSFGMDQGGWIQNLGVHPKYMDQGIGQTLAMHLFELYKKKKIFDIYTAARWDSVDLLSFFKSVGFDRSSFINLHKKLGPKE